MSSTDTDPEKTVTDAPAAADSPDGTATDRTTTDDTATDSADTNARKAKTAKLLPAALGVLCVIMAVVVGLLAWKSISTSNAQKDAVAAQEAASTRAPFVLSYAPATVDADVAKAREQLSGTFAAQFDQLVNQVVLPATKQQGLTSKAETTHSAIIEALPDHADVLLFLKQTITSNGQQPQQGTIQVKVTVTKAPDGQWLVSNLQPI